MLGKLLKYDLRSVGKVWWIAMLTMIFTTFGLAAALRINAEIEVQPYSVELWLVKLALIIAAFLGAVVVGLCFFSVFIMIFIRYFKHLFTDEGYLTFTLPVSRKSIFLSKTISAVLWTVLSHIVLGLCLYIVGDIVLPAYYEYAIFDSAIYVIQSIFESGGFFLILHSVIFMLIIVANSVLLVGVGYFCITLGATVVKRGKLVISIGVFCVLNIIYSFAVRFLGVISMLALLEGLVFRLTTVTFTQVWWALVLFIVLVAILTISAFFYCMTLNIIERKLNLS